MEGLENLPAKDEAAVYVANHQSFLVRPQSPWCSAWAPAQADIHATQAQLVILNG